MLGKFLKVYGFDPLEEEICLLRESPLSAQYDCQWFPMAIADRDDEMTLFVTNGSYNSTLQRGLRSYGGDSLATDSYACQIKEERTVPVRTIDGLVKEKIIPDVDFIKTDTEGFEVEVLTGARKTIQEVGVLGVELETSISVNTTSGSSFFRQAHIFKEMGFDVFDLRFDHFPINTLPFGRIHFDLGNNSISMRDIGRLGHADALYIWNYLNAVNEGREDKRLKLVNKIIKAAIVMELYDINDIAIFSIRKYEEQLKEIFDVSEAIDRLVPSNIGAVIPMSEYLRIGDFMNLGAKINLLVHDGKLYVS